MFLFPLILVTFLAANSTSIVSPPTTPNKVAPIPQVTTPHVATPTVTQPAVSPPRPASFARPIRAAESFPIPMPAIQSIFTSPGIATWQNGRWVGSEHLYNLAQDFGVFVEVIQPQGVSIALDQNLIQDRVMGLLNQEGFRPRTLIVDRTPLPFLHLLIMINPIERGYVIYCSARLFEAVQVERAHLKVDLTWQAITWEKQEMLLFATEQLQTELFKTIDSLITSFTSKLKSYQNLPK